VGSPLPGSTSSSRIGARCSSAPRPLHGLLQGPEQTASALQDGWLHTGDAGLFDPDGQLVIIDRVKDVATLEEHGVPPQYIENKLKFQRLHQGGGGRGSCASPYRAMINIDMEVVGNWAERTGIGYSATRTSPRIRPPTI